MITKSFMNTWHFLTVLTAVKRIVTIPLLKTGACLTRRRSSCERRRWLIKKKTKSGKKYTGYFSRTMILSNFPLRVGSPYTTPRSSLAMRLADMSFQTSIINRLYQQRKMRYLVLM